MQEVRNIRIEDFDYPLPEDRIALHPLVKRDSCKMLVASVRGRDSAANPLRITHSVFSELPLFLKPDTLIVANETKVIRARIEFVKNTGAKIEIFLLEPSEPSDYATSFASCGSVAWTCLIGNRKRWKEGTLSKELLIGGRNVRLHAVLNDDDTVSFSWTPSEISFAEVVEAAGSIPIPPYLKRESEESDTADYQTVYSKTEGSVAAPTAGLHFTPELIEKLKRHGDEFVTVTLHVGAGTFQPVKSEEIGSHPMHSEWISVSRLALMRLISALENGQDILAVGTTSVRTLESLPYLGRIVEERAAGTLPALKVTQWMPYEEKYRRIDTIRALRSLLAYLKENDLDALEADTAIMIAPGFHWRIVNRLITNFHQPKSTLLLLVGSFINPESDSESWRDVYTEALAEGYRFLSYGDACLFSRGPQPVELPAAKSMVIRAATIFAARSPQRLSSLLHSGLCDDSEYYIKALRDVLESVALPLGHLKKIYIGEGAAPLRFLTAFAASLPGAKIEVTCAPGLRKRPIAPLIDTLKAMGADLEFIDSPEDWHIAIRGSRLKGGRMEVDSSFTSQYVSALMLASLLWSEPLSLRENLQMVSKPYVAMTEKMLGAELPEVEPDWSAAAFFYEYCLITGRKVEISSLVPPARSLQGDAAACDVFAMAGVNSEFRNGRAVLSFDAAALEMARERGLFEFNFSDFPDMVPAVAVALCYRGVPFRFFDVGHLRFKECDRLSALQTLLVGIGYGVRAEGDSLVFDGEFKPMAEFPMEIDPYGDHRMAMAFYPLELLGMVQVADKDVVRKSFPNFYQQFK